MSKGYLMKNDSFGIFLKEKRIAAGLSQMAVAVELGYTTSQFISNWERGLSKPPIKMFKKIAKLYKIEAVAILNELTKRDQQWVKEKLARQFARSK